MKKIIAILLMLTLLCGSFVACTGDGEETDAPAGATLADAVEYLNTMYKGDEGKKTPADYILIAQVPIGETSFPITWTTDLEGAEIVSENGTYTVKLPGKNDAELEYTLTATISDSEGKSETKTFKRVLPVYDNSAAVTEPKEGEVYKLFLVQANVGKTLFATAETQNNENKYIMTTEDPKAGVEFQIEAADGGVKIYTMINGVKNYVYAKTTTAEDGKVSKYIGYSTENSSIYTYHADVKAWFTTIDNLDYVVGTYSSYETICISESSYITPENTGISQFALGFMTKAAADEFVPDDTPKDPTELTAIKDINAIGEKLEHNTNTVEKYLVQGTITEIKSEQYGNMYIADAEGNTLYIYGLYSKDGSVRYDAMETKPVVGDIITVMSQVCNYNGPQLKNAALQSIDTPPSNTTPIPDALKAADGTKVAVKGTVKTVDTAWSDQYNNISVTIVDEAGNELYIYRLATKVEQGDIIIVTGEMATYNNNRQIAAGAIAEIKGHVEVTVEYKEMTIPQAIAAADGELVSVKGTVKSIDTAWSDQYNNISVTITDDAGNTLYIYRLATNVNVGDVVIIKGKVGSYNGAKQIAQGATAEIVK